ncbi:uncharacterized protein TRIADDRAFT_50874 [Trichoplax adhaerens]|uniref:T-complex-associated-testis-expressed 1 n=1 Tax=Trichoplax adhaerens TaxID=10228 RepID=B3S841_TRIAD|nr:hypothetical protein TRIADDRAFT_50874 [Trichoplax adhaerens]EDV21037.1 hypothetical protein TRIADDRAFT_50874 [Trichoplax adhaerens]|eukprot:XP_002116367.1 hypothetical protein TRIADDRAFT_50874 [Trichoplax adhaerens]
MNPAADPRLMRRIIAEDPEWSLATVPLLRELCIKHIVGNFKENPILDGLNTKDRAKVLQLLPTDVPISISAGLIEDEGYWKRCCQARWQICDVSKHGGDWKRMFFERNLEDLIEHFVPDSTDPSMLYDVMKLSANFIRCLNIKQLLPPVKSGSKFEDISDTNSDAGESPDVDHFDFNEIISRLTNLQELHVTYGVRDCGMNFEWNLFKFTPKDCSLLAKAVKNCRTLKVLRLHRSGVTDELVRVLISHLLDHPALIALDLSYNKISDSGARAIGKFLNGHSKLIHLNLCGNQIHGPGASAISHALQKNATLRTLNIRVNRLSDEGGQALCKALMKNKILSLMDIGANDLTEPTAMALAKVILHNKVITSINLSCNKLGPDGGKALQESMEENHRIINMDLRLTEVGQESEYCINQVLKRNKENLIHRFH